VTYPDVDNAPASEIEHEGAGLVLNRPVGTVVMLLLVQAELLSKPEPKIVTPVLPVLDPELGVSWIVGRTVKITGGA
jgi:hypothetical protein